MTLIVRSYRSEKKARDAVAALEERELCQGETLLVRALTKPPAEGAAASEARAHALEAAEKALALGLVLGEGAGPYAKEMVAGRTVVVARTSISSAVAETWTRLICRPFR